MRAYFTRVPLTPFLSQRERERGVAHDELQQPLLLRRLFAPGFLEHGGVDPRHVGALAVEELLDSEDLNLGILAVVGVIDARRRRFADRGAERTLNSTL
jgi:hypothetical protein